MFKMRHISFGKLPLALLVSLWVSLVLINQHVEGYKFSEGSKETNIEEPISGQEESTVQATDLIVNHTSQAGLNHVSSEVPEKPEMVESNEGATVLHQFIISQSKNFIILLERVISKNAP